MKLDTPLDWIIHIVRKLGPELSGELMFVGGATLALQITDAGAPNPRPTQDVDVVAQLASYSEYFDFTEKLRTKGFSEDTDEDSPLCRWIIDGIKVDVIPDQQAALGFSNTWYPVAFSTVRPHLLDDQSGINVIGPTYFIATKLEAFRSRGNQDYVLSHDIEDIVAVVDGRLELLDEFRRSGGEVRRYVAKELTIMLGDADFLDALAGHLPGDSGSQARLPRLQARLEELASQVPPEPLTPRSRVPRTISHPGRSAFQSSVTRTSVRSSDLNSVGYDAQWQVLEVGFRKGTVYRYFGVPTQVYEGLMSASSKGRYLDRVVKKGGYRYSRVS